MKFVLHEICIWFKREQTPRVLEFLPNKVNVITGDSGSGKTNILAIIDYCLLSRNSNIVDAIINDNAEWYSILFTLNGARVSISRRKMNLEMEHSEICMFEGSNLPTYPQPNINIEDARLRLDELFNISNKIRYPFKKENGIYPLQISYRSYLLYSYLTERIITLDNVFLDFDYFEKILFGDYKQYVVSNALGFDDSKRKRLQEELDTLKKENEKFHKEQKSNQKKNDKFVTALNDFLKKLRENDILTDNETYESPQDIISVIKDTISQFVKSANIEQDNEELSRLKKTYRTLNLQYKNIQKAEKDIEEYNSHIEKYKDSLRPIEALNQKSNEIARSYETQQLIDALKRSFSEIKQADLNKVSMTLVSPLEKEKLKRQLKDINDEIKKYTPTNDSKEKKPKQYMIIANVERDFNNLLKTQSDLLPIKEYYIPNYVDKCFELQQAIAKEESSRPALENAVNQALQYFYNQLNFMGAYTGNDILFDWDNFLVQLRTVGKKYPHRNLGSKSNYMFLHLCFFLGIHKHFTTLSTDNHVLPFLFIDQPSIPYYAGSETVKNDDKEQLTDAFSLLNRFIGTMNNKMGTDFQIILIEHAPPSYWTEPDLENFHLVDEFTQGNKLIPQSIIDDVHVPVLQF